MIYANDRDHLDSLGKLRRPSVKSDSSLSWTSNNPKATLQAWAPLDSKAGKLSPTTGRPSSATTVPAENDTGKEDGELPSTGATDMDVTMKTEVDTRDGDGGAEGVTGEPSPEGSSKPVDEAGAAAAADEGEIRQQQDVEMGEASGEDLPSPGSRTFRAVLRKENSGKRVELEAQVTHSLTLHVKTPSVVS